MTGGCILNGEYYASAMTSKYTNVDRCSSCNCFNESSHCRKKACPVLDCSIENQEQRPSECCPVCNGNKVENFEYGCSYGGVTYQVSISIV